VTVTGLHHVQVAIPPGGEPQARTFYGDVLGMTEVAKPPALAARGGAWFRSGAAELHLGVDEPFRPAAKAHPAFAVTDLDAMAARLAAAGLDITPDDLFPGHRRVYVDDPFGNRVELLEATDPS
jgi:catechol 2,3-dioxygenase-like lactoylglutathione lyase family enzyme